jgi:hypothetical protein
MRRFLLLLVLLAGLLAPADTLARSAPGHVFLDSDLLKAGRFSWGTVQHEFGHQVDFLLLDDAKRAMLAGALGGRLLEARPRRPRPGSDPTELPGAM